MSSKIKITNSKGSKDVVLFVSALTFLGIVIKTITKDTEKPIQKTYSDY